MEVIFLLAIALVCAIVLLALGMPMKTIIIIAVPAVAASLFIWLLRKL